MASENILEIIKKELEIPKYASREKMKEWYFGYFRKEKAKTGNDVDKQNKLYHEYMNRSPLHREIKDKDKEEKTRHMIFSLILTARENYNLDIKLEALHYNELRSDGFELFPSKIFFVYNSSKQMTDVKKVEISFYQLLQLFCFNSKDAELNRRGQNHINSMLEEYCRNCSFTESLYNHFNMFYPSCVTEDNSKIQGDEEECSPHIINKGSTKGRIIKFPRNEIDKNFSTIIKKDIQDLDRHGLNNIEIIGFSNHFGNNERECIDDLVLNQRILVLKQLGASNSNYDATTQGYKSFRLTEHINLFISNLQKTKLDNQDDNRSKK